jgi:hypothetical protein
MTAQNSLMINVLYQDYPDIASIITDKINAWLPEQTAHDISLIENVVLDFNTELSISGIVWSNSTGRVNCKFGDDEIRMLKITEVREMLVAVVLMFFNPEKILGLSNAAASKGIVKELSRLTDCSKSQLSFDINNAISYYKRSYRGFRADVDMIYAAIKVKRNYF